MDRPARSWGRESVRKRACGSVTRACNRLSPSLVSGLPSALSTAGPGQPVSPTCRESDKPPSAADRHAAGTSAAHERDRQEARRPAVERQVEIQPPPGPCATVTRPTTTTSATSAPMPALQQPFGHERPADERRRRAHQLHDLDFVPARVQPEPDHAGHGHRGGEGQQERQRHARRAARRRGPAPTPRQPFAVVAHVGDARQRRHAAQQRLAARRRRRRGPEAGPRATPGTDSRPSSAVIDASSANSRRKRASASVLRDVLAPARRRRSDRAPPRSHAPLLGRGIVAQVDRELGALPPPRQHAVGVARSPGSRAPSTHRAPARWPARRTPSEPLPRHRLAQPCRSA